MAANRISTPVVSRRFCLALSNGIRCIAHSQHQQYPRSISNPIYSLPISNWKTLKWPHSIFSAPICNKSIQGRWLLFLIHKKAIAIPKHNSDTRPRHQICAVRRRYPHQRWYEDCNNRYVFASCRIPAVLRSGLFTAFVYIRKSLLAYTSLGQISIKKIWKEKIYSLLNAEKAMLS